MPDLDPAAVAVAVHPPKRWVRRLWRFLLILLCIGFLAINGAAYLAARTMTHYVPNVARPHIHVPMTAWDKTRLFLGTLSLPRPVNEVTPADRKLDYETLYFPGAHGLKLEAWRIPGKAGQPVALLFPGRFKAGNRRRVVDEMINVFLDGISNRSNLHD